MRAKLADRDKLVLLLSEGFTDRLQQVPGSTTFLSRYVFHVPGMYNDSLWYLLKLLHNVIVLVWQDMKAYSERSLKVQKIRKSKKGKNKRSPVNP